MITFDQTYMKSFAFVIPVIILMISWVNGHSKNVVVLWLNDNEIICNAGLGCENESIDQGRTYVDKNIHISNCFFSRYLEYSGYGGVIYFTASNCSITVFVLQLEE